MKLMIRNLIFLLLLTITVYSQNGIVVTKYSNGNIATELSFVNDVYDGTSYWYYENGYLKTEKTFSSGKLNGWVREYYETGIVKEERYVKDGILDGLLKYYYQNGGLQKVMRYDKGILMNLTEVPYDVNYQAPITAERSGKSKKNRSKIENDILCNVEVCPEPLGGIKTIYDNLIYPNAAKLYGLEGEVLLLVKIDEAGRVLNSQVIKALDLGCSEAAVDAIDRTRFTPGLENGKPVVSETTIRVKFELETPVKIDTLVSGNIVEIESDSTETEKVEQQKHFTNFQCNLDICPKPIGGLKSITDALRIPPYAERNDIKGYVQTIVNIDEFGFVTDVKIEEGLGIEIDNSIIETLLNTRFEPGKEGGKFSAAVMRIKIPFRLDL